MFIKMLIGYIVGYVRIVVEGYYIERFINLCTSQKIAIWSLKREKNVKLFLNVGIHDFKKLIPIARKVQCKVKIQKKKGIPFILNRYKKRKIFLAFFLIIVTLLFISSNFVWNVEIREENNLEIENIMQDLEEQGLKPGVSKNNVDTKSIINNIRLKRDDIAWMGIELKGTNAIVRIVKSDEKPEIIDESEYCNIVSDKSGVITKINAQNGTAMVNVGDTVNIGTTLIAGWMEGKYTGMRYVHSKGEIEAKVWYTKSKKIYYEQNVTEPTGKEEKQYSLKINNFKINFHKGVSKFEIYDTIDEEKKFKIFSDFYLPISIITTTNKEKKSVEKTYSIEEAKQIGLKELEEELNNEIENKEAIVNKNCNIYENEDYVEVELTYEVIENIGTNEKIVF